MIWAEHEPADPCELGGENDLSAYYFSLLEERLDLYARDNRFGLEPLDVHVVSLCRAMALDTTLARRWRELPDPPDEAFEFQDDALPRRDSG